MADDFAPIADLARALLHNLDAPHRRTLLRQIGRYGQSANRARIGAQQNPDGSAFAERRAKKPSKKGAIRRKAMFRKLRMAKHLKAGATDNEAWFGFSGPAARIARIHQEGLADAPAPGQAKVRYAARILVGLSDENRERVMDMLLEQATRGI